MISSGMQAHRPFITARTNSTNPDLIRVTITEGGEYAVTMPREAWRALLAVVGGELADSEGVAS